MGKPGAAAPGGTQERNRVPKERHSYPRTINLCDAPIDLADFSIRSIQTFAACAPSLRCLMKLDHKDGGSPQ
jgi:hypothetical protein